MRPFLGFSEKERMFFAMLHDRSELEASIKEGSLLLLGELEYLLLIDSPKVDIEWSMEVGKDYFGFPVPLAGGGSANCYVSFDYERGFFPYLSNDRADPISKRAFVEVLGKNRSELAGLEAVVDEDGALSIQDPGLAARDVSDADLARWAKEGTELAVGRMFNPGDAAFANRSILKRVHTTVRGLMKCFSGA